MSASISKSIVWVGFPWEEASLKLLKGRGCSTDSRPPSKAANPAGRDSVDGQRAAVNPPPGPRAQILVVVTQMPHHIAYLSISDRPVGGDARDADQRIVGSARPRRD